MAVEREGAYLQIGEVAERTGVTQRTLRFYEEKGLLKPPSRMEGGFRLYSEEDVQRVAEIRRLQSLLGFSLAEIKEIIAIRQGRRPPCSHVHHLLEKKADELDRKLKDLLELRRRVRQSLAAWKRAPSGKAAVCPHIESRSVDERRRVVATRKRRRPYATD